MRQISWQVQSPSSSQNVASQGKRLSYIILIHRKSDPSGLKNYRPISLLSHIYKLFTKILTEGIDQQINGHQDKDQAGFRSGRSTIDHIHTLNQLKKKAREYNLPITMTFVNYEKAFDSVETNAICNAFIRCIHVLATEIFGKIPVASMRTHGRGEEMLSSSGWTLIGSELSSPNFNSSVRAERPFAIRYLNVVIKPLCGNLDICLNYYANA